VVHSFIFDSFVFLRCTPYSAADYFHVNFTNYQQKLQQISL